MANYSLISNAVFQPFTYQELTAPLDRQELLQDTLDEQYDALAEKASLLAQLEQSEIDKGSELVEQYRNYMNSLDSEVDALNSNGLTPTSRARWHALRRSYSSDIMPIQQMWAKRLEEVKQQDAAYFSDPTLEFSRDARNTPLQYYRDNPLGGYKAYSGKMFADAVGKVAANLKEVARRGKNGHYVQMNGITPDMYETIVENGYTPEQIENWRNDPVLSGIMSSALNAMGITQENLGGDYERIKNKMLGYGQMALSDAVGKPTIGTAENWKYRTDHNWELGQKAADKELERQKDLDNFKTQNEITKY